MSKTIPSDFDVFAASILFCTHCASTYRPESISLGLVELVYGYCGNWKYRRHGHTPADAVSPGWVVLGAVLSRLVLH